MTGPFFLLLSLLAAPSPAELAQGVWLPTPGLAGEGTALALAKGGDGAIYSAGEGLVRRIEPGGRWRVIGRYAPRLQWNGEDSVEAIGEFSPSFLQAVSLDVEESIDGAGLILSADLDEDLVISILQDYVDEADTDPESPYSVAGLATAKDGVWIGTGSGLFYAKKGQVTGPVGPLVAVEHLLGTRDGLTAATTDGIYSVAPSGQSRRWRLGPAQGLTRAAGKTWWLADDALWHAADPAPLLVNPPTGLPRLVAGHGESLYVATELAVYRYHSGAWSLCGPVSEPLTQIRVAEGLLIGIADESLYLADGECQRFHKVGSPWPGGMRLTDALWSEGSLWAASTEGVFLLGPPDGGGKNALDVAGFRRQARKVPLLGAVLEHAQKAHALDRASTSYGSRPVWRHLLPEVQLRGFVNARRTDQNPTLVRGRGTLTTLPPERNRSMRVMFQWTIPTNILMTLFDVDRAAGIDAAREAAQEAALDLAESEFEVDDDIEGAQFFEVDNNDLEVEFDEDAAAAALAQQIARERRQAERDRQRLFKVVSSLYRERMRLLFRLWTSPPDASGPENRYTAVLRLDEIDALLDVKTGGAFSRLRR